MNIYTETTGSGQDIVLLHGWTHTHKSMQPIADLLKDHYRVTSIDLPGLGESTWDPAIDSITDIVSAIIDTLPNSAIYIAWSFGGLVTTAIAAQYPQKVKQIIGIATTPKFIESKNWPGFPAPGFTDAFQIIKTTGLQKILVDFYLDESNCSITPSIVKQELNKLIEFAEHFDTNILFKGYQICDKADLRKQLQQVQCPIDFIFGEHDDAIPTLSHTYIKDLNQRINIHMIKGAKHLPHWTHKNEIKHILNRILGHEK